MLLINAWLTVKLKKVGNFSTYCKKKKIEQVILCNKLFYFNIC